MDEYERAASELKHLIERLPEDEFLRVVDAQTMDDDCRSAQTIMAHVVSAGYGYADYIRAVFSLPTARPAQTLLPRQDALEQFDAMLAYTVQTLAGRWEMSDEEITGVVVRSRWGVTYDLEQLLEHAIVHILRHRRQIERFIQQGKLTVRRSDFPGISGQEQTVGRGDTSSD